MPSLKLRGSIRAILQRRALGRSHAAARAAKSDKSELLAYEAAALSNGNILKKDNNGNIDLTNERKGHGTSNVSFEMRGRDRTCTTGDLYSKWKISWYLEDNERSSSTIVFNVDHIHHKSSSDYEIRFNVLLKNYGLLLYKKKLIQVQDDCHHTVIISFRCPDICSTETMNWSDVIVSGDIVLRKAGNAWMYDLRSHCSFLLPDRPHDRVLIVGSHRFYVQSVYLATWSRFFDGLFSGHFREARQREIVLHDVDPKQFIDLLLLIHPRLNTGINEENYAHLLLLARYFDMPSVSSMCSAWLSDFGHRKRMFVIDRLEIADKFELKGLLNVCCRYLLTHNDVLLDFLIRHQSRLEDLSKKTQKLVKVALSSKDPNAWW